MPVTWNIPTPKMARSSKNWNNKASAKLSRRPWEACSKGWCKKGKFVWQTYGSSILPIFVDSFAIVICWCLPYYYFFSIFFNGYINIRRSFSHQFVWSWMKLQAGSRNSVLGFRDYEVTSIAGVLKKTKGSDSTWHLETASKVWKDHQQFKDVFFFSPDFWENDPFWRIFSKWVETTN